MLKENILKKGRGFQSPFLLLCIPMLFVQVLAGGVTLITHGLNGNVRNWVTAMGRAITTNPNYLGTNSSILEMNLTLNNGKLSATTRKIAGSVNFNENVSGEIVVLLDWSTLADGIKFNTFEVAAAVTPYLTSTNFIADLRGHALAELPLHLIGHSRGGSLVCEISRVLGSNGIWVDHLTTLDPHPLNNDGFFNPIYFIVDAPAKTYENVLFHDNVFQDQSWPIYGESVAGAYVRELLDVSGGYSGLGGAHSDTHLWYHGTIDFALPAYDSEESITEAERQRWWTGEEAFGVLAGFHFSRIGGGNRMSTSRPAGVGTARVSEGFNQMWDFGAGTAQNRTVLAENSREWPNIIELKLEGGNVIAQGRSNSISVFIQPSQNSLTEPVLTILVDEDFNPWNGNERILKEIPLARNPTHQIGYGTVNFLVDGSNSTIGVHAILSRITGSGQTRYLYAKELLTVMSSDEPPLLTLTPGADASLGLEVNGQVGQRIVIEHSVDLAGWIPVRTNWLSEAKWTYVDAAFEQRRFYRAVLR